MPVAFNSCFTLGYGAFRAIRNSLIALIFCAPMAWAAPQIVVALGDSLTAGYGLPREDGFVPQLQRWLAGQGAEATVINAGVSGDTTAGGLSRLDWSLTPETTALIVNLGGNDLLRGLDPGTSRANLEKILQGAQSKGLPVLLVGMQSPGNYGPEFKASFDAIYPDLATKYGAILLPDYFAPIAPADDRTGLLAKYMQADGIHPNAAGVARIVEAIGPKVLDLLKKSGG